MKKYKNDEFFNIIDKIISNEEFSKTKEIDHHGITRYNHCLRVAYYSFLITKFLHLDYKKVTEAALLHDFFIDEVEDKNFYGRLTKHSKYALVNASKYFDLNDMQKDIILTHMFPVTFTPPKYIESWIVDLVDDIAAIYEKFYSVRLEMRAAFTFLLLLFINYIRVI